MDVSYDNPTMTQLTNLSSYLGRQPQKEEPSSETDSDHNDDDSEGSGAEPMDEDGEGTTEPKPVKVKRGPRSKYRSYQPSQWQAVVDTITNRFGLITISEASRLAGIHERTGRHVMQKYMEDPDAGIPINLKPRGGGAGRPPKLNKEHTVYIKKFFKGAADAYVKDLQAAIKRDFNGLEVSETTLQRHIKKHCHFSLKRRQAQPEARFNQDLLVARKKWVEEWPSKEDYMERAVFIDEAGFNLHMRRLYGWSQRGKKSKKGGKDGDDRSEFRQSPVIKVPNRKGVNLSVIGAICWDGVLNLTLRTPDVSRKRPRVSGKKKKAS
ncbi:hypothetical protein BGZ81_004472, partial [Podila clonocystis]